MWIREFEEFDQPDSRRVTVRQGDSLWRLLERECWTSNQKELVALIRATALINEIRNPDLIFAGQQIEIPSVVPLDLALPNELASNMDWSRPPLFDCYTGPVIRKANEWIEPEVRNTGINIPGVWEDLARMDPLARAMAFGLPGGLANVGEESLKILGEMTHNFEKYVSGSISKYEYDKARVALRARLTMFANNPKILNLTASIGRKQRVLFAETGKISRNLFPDAARHLGEITRAASHVGKVVYFLDIGLTVHDAVNAETERERNRIITAGAGSLLGGLVASSFLGVVFLSSGPVGWGIGLAIGAGSGIVSWLSGEMAGRAYEVLHVTTIYSSN